VNDRDQRDRKEGCKPESPGEEALDRL
jgi:hypothetical protein